MVIGRLYQDWDRPGHGERLLLPLLGPDGTREGLIGTTICRLTFDSRQEAEERARRLTVVLPLDGSPASETLNCTCRTGAPSGRVDERRRRRHPGRGRSRPRGGCRGGPGEWPQPDAA